MTKQALWIVSIVGLAFGLFASVRAAIGNASLVSTTVFDGMVEEQFKVFGKYDYTRYSENPSAYASTEVRATLAHYAIPLPKGSQVSAWKEMGGGSERYVCHVQRMGDFLKTVGDYKSLWPSATPSWNKSKTTVFLRQRASDGALLEVVVGKMPNRDKPNDRLLVMVSISR